MFYFSAFGMYTYKSMIFIKKTNGILLNFENSIRFKLHWNKNDDVKCKRALFSTCPCRQFHSLPGL